MCSIIINKLLSTVYYLPIIMHSRGTTYFANLLMCVPYRFNIMKDLFNSVYFWL